MLNSPVCLDANLVVHLVTSGERDAAIVHLWREWHEAGRPIVAPTLLHYEVSNALHRYVVHGVYLPEEAAKLLDMALGLRIILFGHATLHRRALLLAGQFELSSAYDAHYLAVAEVFGAELWTADQRLFQAVSGSLPWVHLVKAWPSPANPSR